MTQIRLPSQPLAPEHIALTDVAQNNIHQPNAHRPSDHRPSDPQSSDHTPGNDQPGLWSPIGNDAQVFARVATALTRTAQLQTAHRHVTLSQLCELESPRDALCLYTSGATREHVARGLYLGGRLCFISGRGRLGPECLAELGDTHVDAQLMELSGLNLELLLAATSATGHYTTQTVTLEPAQAIAQLQQQLFCGVALLEYGLRRVMFKIDAANKVTHGSLESGLGRRAHLTSITWSGERCRPLIRPASSGSSRPHELASGQLSSALFGADRPTPVQSSADRPTPVQSSPVQSSPVQSSPARLLEAFEQIAAQYIGAGAAKAASQHLAVSHRQDGQRLQAAIEQKMRLFGAEAVSRLAAKLSA